jgi:hypothetical protein
MPASLDELLLDFEDFGNTVWQWPGRPRAQAVRRGQEESVGSV